MSENPSIWSQRAFEFIVDVARPHLAQGGNIHTKGSGGIPTKLRALIVPGDQQIPVRWISTSAKGLPRASLQIDHVLPLKRIFTEMIDPAFADPRSNTSFLPLAGGPATSPKHLEEIFFKLCEKCFVTKAEHNHLNKFLGGSKPDRGLTGMQWDAPNGDGWQRYRCAGIEVEPYSEYEL